MDQGLWRFDLNQPNPDGGKHSVKQVTFVDTVADRATGYTKRQQERALVAKNLYETIGFPSIEDFKNIIRMNGIKNCPVTVDDIKMCVDIHGPNIHALKGKSVRSKPPVVTTDYVEIPGALKDRNRMVDLCADIMFVQGIPFLATVSKRIRFLTIAPLPARTRTALCEAFDKTFRVCNKNDFEIATLHVDPEFRKVEDVMIDNNIDVRYAAAQQHVPEIERMIRVIKERCRALHHRLPC